MNLSNLPPGVSNSDVDPPQTPFERYLEEMPEDDFAAFGGDCLWDNTPMLEALNRLWDAAESRFWAT